MNIDPGELLKNFQGLQGKMNEVQSRLSAMRVTGFAGGDMVKIEMNGHMQITDIRISAEAIDPDDTQITEDLVKAAFNDALSRVKDRINEEISSITGGMGMPPGGFPGMQQ